MRFKTVDRLYNLFIAALIIGGLLLACAKTPAPAGSHSAAPAATSGTGTITKAMQTCYKDCEYNVSSDSKCRGFCKSMLSRTLDACDVEDTYTQEIVYYNIMTCMTSCTSDNYNEEDEVACWKDCNGALGELIKQCRKQSPLL